MSYINTVGYIGVLNEVSKYMSINSHCLVFLNNQEWKTSNDKVILMIVSFYPCWSIIIYACMNIK